MRDQSVGVQPSGCPDVPSARWSPAFRRPERCPARNFKQHPKLPLRGTLELLNPCPQPLGKHRYLICKSSDPYSRLPVHKSRTTPSAVPLPLPRATFCAHRLDAEPDGFPRTGCDGVWSKRITLCNRIVRGRNAAGFVVVDAGRGATSETELSVNGWTEEFESRFVKTAAHNDPREVTVKSARAMLRDWTASLCFDTAGCMFSPRVQRGDSLLAQLRSEPESCNRGRGNSLSHDANSLGRGVWRRKEARFAICRFQHPRNGPPYCAGASGRSRVGIEALFVGDR
jgi:hypothetical protein